MAKEKKSNVIPFPIQSVAFDLPESAEPVVLLDHPDVQVVQEGEQAYRIRVGEVELTYNRTMDRGAWYIYLPGHEQRERPVTTDQYDPENQPFMINIDRDRRNIAFGIEIV